MSDDSILKSIEQTRKILASMSRELIAVQSEFESSSAKLKKEFGTDDEKKLKKIKADLETEMNIIEGQRKRLALKLEDDLDDYRRKLEKL